VSKRDLSSKDDGLSHKFRRVPYPLPGFGCKSYRDSSWARRGIREEMEAAATGPEIVSILSARCSAAPVEHFVLTFPPKARACY
jgi:hypothetical protein